MIDKKIAILIPCYNEESTVKKVIDDFSDALPNAKIFFYDNNSTDNSVYMALQTDAIVKKEKNQGKGSVVRSMFKDIDADIYLLADADGEHIADFALDLIKPILENRADMTVGNRYADKQYKNRSLFHFIGNKIVIN